MYGVNAWLEGTKENFANNRASVCVRKITTAWNDRIALINGLMGIGTTNTGAVVQYAYPATYPAAPWLYVDGIEVDGEGILSTGAEMEEYEWARMQVTYKVPEQLYGVESGVQSLEYGDEILTFPTDQNAFNWDGGPLAGKPVEAAIIPSITITLITYTYMRKFQPMIPVDLITSCTDHTNSDSLLGGDAGTVLYKGAQTTRRILMTGTENWDITHKFIYRSVGWNSFLLPGSGFFPIVRIDNGQPPFPQTDLSGLLNS